MRTTKEAGNRYSKLITYILDWGYSYSKQALDDVKIICYDRKIYLLQTRRRCVLDWYRFYLNHPCGSRLAKTIWELWYWKVLITQTEQYAKPCKICQQFKKRKNVYGNLPPKNIAEPKPWESVHVDLIGPHIKSIRQQKMCSSIIRNNVSLTCMMMNNPAVDWFKIVDIPM